jgi:thiosulfate sulfurtransferase
VRRLELKSFEIVHTSELEAVLQERGTILIDIRDREAYRREHWPGARNCPFDELEQGKIILPKNRKLLLYCEHGGGSMQLARRLGQEGYRVATVVGGYQAMKKVQETYFKNGRNV